MRKPNILLVDDEVAILKAITRALFKMDWDITACSSPKEALNIAGEKQWDLLVADYRMAEMNGLELLKQFKEICPEAVRIMMTGYSDIDVIISAINQGNIYKYISKPWENDQLVAVLKEALKKKFRDEAEKVYESKILQCASELAQKVQGLKDKIVVINPDGVKELLDIIRTFDDAYYKKGLTMAWVSQKIAEKTALKSYECSVLKLASLFHNIGHIAIRTESDLNNTEDIGVNDHGVVVSLIFKEMEFMKDIAHVLYQHHEAYDGSGSPKGLKGEQICMGARILAVAEMYVDHSFEAGIDQGLEAVYQWSGRCFDPLIIQTLEQVVKSEAVPSLEWLEGWCVK